MQELLTSTENQNASISVEIDSALDFVYENLGLVDLVLSHNFTVVETFSNPLGKIPATFGDAVIIDCNYANSLIMNFYDREHHRFFQTNPVYFSLLRGIDNILKERINAFDFCNFAT